MVTTSEQRSSTYGAVKAFISSDYTFFVLYHPDYKLFICIEELIEDYAICAGSMGGGGGDYSTSSASNNAPFFGLN